MKKAFIMSFSTPILIEVIKNLKDKHIQVLYWQGYRDAFDELSRTKDGFQDTIFRHSFDSNKNIYPKEVDASKFETPSQEIIEKMYPYGWHALSMISRTSYGNPAFVKRRNLYYSYVRFWDGMLKKFKPDVIIFNSVPHLASGFVLYGLAKLLNIKIVILERIVTLGSRAVIQHQYEDIPGLSEAYENTNQEMHNIENLSEDLKEHYFSKRKDFDPDSMGRDSHSHLRTHKNKMPYRVPTIYSILKNIVQLTFFKTLYSYLRMLFSKRMTYYHEKDFTGLELMLLSRRLGRMSKALKKEYKKLEKKPDYQKKYVYIPLAFQPEHTTLPMGGVYDDQLLMIDMVSQTLPDGWVIYVKEHLPQWYPFHTQAYHYRYKGYYKHIDQKKNVILVPAETNPRELIKHSQTVATVTGTASWESLLSNKPSLVFGSVWYMHCKGIFRISEEEQCKDALQKIEQGYRVEQGDIIRYLHAVNKVSVKAKNYKSRSFKEEGISKEENINTLTQLLSKAINE